MKPGCKVFWAANITLQDPKNGNYRLVNYQNDQNIKSRNIESNADLQQI